MGTRVFVPRNDTRAKVGRCRDATLCCSGHLPADPFREIRAQEIRAKANKEAAQPRPHGHWHVADGHVLLLLVHDKGCAGYLQLFAYGPSGWARVPRDCVRGLRNAWWHASDIAAVRHPRILHVYRGLPCACGAYPLPQQGACEGGPAVEGKSDW